MALPLVGVLAELAKGVLDRVLPDQKQKADALFRLAELEQSGELARLAADTDLAKGQMRINEIEAANANLFISGWRPACGWICVAGLAMQFVVGPLITWGSALAGRPVVFPTLDMGTMMALLGGLLGLGSLRTVERLSGKANGQTV